MKTPLERRGLAASQHDGWLAALHSARDNRAALVQAEPDPSTARRVLLADLDIARLSAAVGDPESLAGSVNSAAAWGAAASVCESFTTGSVGVRIGQEPARRGPAGADCLLPPEWFDATACAVLVRNAELLRSLARPELVDLVFDKTSRRREPVGAEAFWRSYCQLFAAVMLQQPLAPEIVSECRALLTRGDPGLIEPDNLHAEKEPLLDLIEALAARDLQHWDSLVRAALDRFDAFYSQPDWRTLRIGMLPLGVAALSALACDRFDLPPVDSVYLPSQLIRGQLPRATIELDYAFPHRAANGAAEIHWAFDLEGIPRAGREHRLIEQDGALVAQYEVSGWSVVPRATAAFELRDSPTPVLLDPGELLLVSDLHARQVYGQPDRSPDTLRRERMHLQEALDALDAVLRQIPEGARSVPAETLHSERGRAAFNAEPGRFSAARVQAVRDTYARLLAEIDTLLQTPAPDAAAARQNALFSADVIKAQVLPILEAIGRDRTGEVARLLRPRSDDYARVFVDRAVDAARQAYEALWAAPLDLAYPSADQTQLQCGVAPAGMLADDNELSRPFPGGYRKLARWLDPHRVWVRWKYVRPGETSGLAYDGLVWCEDHWAWFPKPYRVLAAALAPDE